MVANEEHLSLIREGMTYREVTAIIGSPQERITSGLVVVEYAFEDGAFAHIEYVMNSEGLYIVESVKILEKEGMK